MIAHVLAPLISLSLLMLGNGFFQTFISAYLHIANHSSMMIGFVQAAYYGGFLVGALKIEPLIQRIRHIRAFSFFASILTAVSLMQGLFIDPIAWVILRFVGGVCIASLYVVIESWLLITTEGERRGVVLALYMIVLYASQAVAQYIIDMLNITHLTPYLVTGFLCVLAILPVTFTRTVVPDLPAHRIKNLIGLYRATRLGFFGSFFGGVFLGGIYSFLPIYAQDKHLNIALVMSVTIAGGFFLQYPFGKLSDVIDRRRVIILITVLTVVFSALIHIPIASKWYQLILLFLIGGVTFTIYPLSITHVCDRCQPHDITKVTGIMLFVYSFGAVIGPLVTPLFMNVFKVNGLFTQIFISSLILLGIGVYALFRYKPVPLEEQGPFVPVSAQTPLNYELDPRVEGEGEKS